LREDNLLSLKADVFWPFHKACKVSFGLNVLADGEIFGTSLKQRVLCSLGGLASAKRRRGGLLSGSFLNGRLVIETGASVIHHGADRRQCVAPRSSNARRTKVHTSPANTSLPSGYAEKKVFSHDVVIQAPKTLVSSNTKHREPRVPLANANKQVDAYH